MNLFIDVGLDLGLKLSLLLCLVRLRSGSSVVAIVATIAVYPSGMNSVLTILAAAAMAFTELSRFGGGGGVEALCVWRVPGVTADASWRQEAWPRCGTKEP